MSESGTSRRFFRACDRHGAIVKTIGDAVMAVFDNPVEATSAALEMIDALNEFNHTISQELILKVGIHRGHSMAVTDNERIDYFGQSVNIAARVQGLADAIADPAKGLQADRVGWIVGLGLRRGRGERHRER